MATWYRRTYGRGRRRPVAVCRVTVPANYAATLLGLRCRLGLSQQRLADKVGAASKAVVYQWESGKRKPSPVFWLRIERLQRQLALLRPDGNARPGIPAGGPRPPSSWNALRRSEKSDRANDYRFNG
jgi:DNA-binding XRE family transcriptional regulator